MDKKQIGVWIRVSTEETAQGESPKVHMKRARLYAQLHDYNIREIYDLSGLSGESIVDYKETQRMLFDIKRGHIQGIIFSKLARLGRNTRELLDLADYFQEHNAHLISLQESFDTSTPAGRLFFSVLSALAQCEREETVDRVKTSIKIRAQMGKRLGGKVPYGYTWDGHQLIIEPKEAAVRKLIFELFVQEKRKKTVAKILNERGYTTRSGKQFYDSNVVRWIRDPLSKGIRISNHTRKVKVNGKQQTEYKPKDEWFYHKAPAIVSEELWDRANAILDEQESKRKKPLNRKVHAFTGFIFCECGSRMSVRSGNKFYRCTQKGCGNKIIREDFEEIFKEQLKGYVSSRENIEEYLSMSDTTVNDKKNLFEKQTLQKDILKQKLDSIILLHSEGKIPTEAFNEYHDKPYNELKIIEKELTNLESEIQFLSMKKNSVVEVMNQALSVYDKWDSFDMPKKRQLVELITEKIIIGKDDKITIQLYRLLPTSNDFFETKSNGQRNPYL